MYVYDNLPIETVPHLQPGPIEYALTIFRTCSPWDILRIEIHGETYEHKLGYGFQWDEIETNLLFDVEDRDHAIDQVKAIVNYFRTVGDNLKRLRFYDGNKICINGFMNHEVYVGEEMDVVPSAAWDELPIDEENVNRALANTSGGTPSSSMRRRIFKSREKLTELNTVYDINDMTDQTVWVVSNTTRKAQPQRDNILFTCKEKSKSIVRSLTRPGEMWGDGLAVVKKSDPKLPGIGIISMWPLRRILNDFCREYVELDARYPQFISHIMRMESDPLIKIIVMDHMIDDYNVRQIEEQVNPTVHTSQFRTLAEYVKASRVTKPVVVRTSYPGLASMLHASGVFVTATPLSTNNLLSQMVEIALMNNILYYGTEIDELADDVSKI